MRFAATFAGLLGVVTALAGQTFSVARGFSVAVAPVSEVAGFTVVSVKGRTSPELPEGSVRYARETHTQSITVLDGRDTIRRVRIKDLPDRRWHQSGGMDGVEFKSEKFRLIPKGQKVRTWIGDIAVKNSFGHLQNNRGIRREYPAGTRFDDVLRNADGVIFEHRTRTKDAEGYWTSEVTYEDPDARPKGYSGVTVRCGSCHGEAGTGSYDAGLVPGGDGTLSDPLDWSLVGSDEQLVARQRVEAPVRQAPVRFAPASPQAVLRTSTYCPT